MRWLLRVLGLLLPVLGLLLRVLLRALGLLRVLLLGAVGSLPGPPLVLRVVLLPLLLVP